MNIDEFEATQNGGQPDADIEKAFDDVPAEQESVPAPESEPNEPEASPESEPDVTEPEADSDPEPTPERKVQTPEENARFAEERRQRQAEERAAAALEKLKQEDPAFQTAKLLEEIYGAPITQIQAQLQQARIAKMAEQQGISVDAVQQIENEKAAVARAQEQAALAQHEVTKMQFEKWTARVELEGQQLRKQYPVLTENDIFEATNYMLNTLKNADLPLEQVVHAVHGAKLTEAIKQQAKTEALAEISGRKQTPIPPQGGKPTAAETLTDAEKYVAKQMGLSEEEYIKWR
jgi:hypothetical protein